MDLDYGRGVGRGVGRGGGESITINFMSAVHSFDLIPSSYIYDHGRWITPWRVDIFFWSGGARAEGRITTINFTSAVHSFDLIPSSFKYDDGRWITPWRVNIFFWSGAGRGGAGPVPGRGWKRGEDAIGGETANAAGPGEKSIHVKHKLFDFMHLGWGANIIRLSFQQLGRIGKFSGRAENFCYYALRVRVRVGG